MGIRAGPRICVKIDIQVTVWFHTEGGTSGYDDPHSWGALKFLCVIPVRSLNLIGTLLFSIIFKK